MRLVLVVAMFSVELQHGRESTRLTVLFLILDKNVSELRRQAPRSASTYASSKPSLLLFLVKNGRVPVLHQFVPDAFPSGGPSCQAPAPSSNLTRVLCKRTSSSAVFFQTASTLRLRRPLPCFQGATLRAQIK
jgi:hypothetical protein